MKALKINIFTLFLCLFAMTLFAQQETESTTEDQIIIIQTEGDENSERQIIKIIGNGEEMENSLEDMNFNIEVDVDDDGNKKTIIIQKTNGNGETEVIEWEGDGEIPSDIQEKMGDIYIFKSDDNDANFFSFKGGSCDQTSPANQKALMGVYLKKEVQKINGVETIEGESEDGVLVDDIVSDGGAEAAGMQAGDIITAIDGTTLANAEDLTNKLATYKPGDKVLVNYLRDTKPQEVMVTLSGSQRQPRFIQRHKNVWHSQDMDFKFDFDVDPCKVFIGVHLDVHPANTTNGLAVRNVIPNTPAEAAGLVPGDVITAIDDAPVNSHAQIISERDKHAAGDIFTIAYIRNGQNLEVDAKFKACDIIKEEVVKEEEVEVINTPEENLNVSPSIPSIEALELEAMRAFPNPTSGVVNVQFKSEAVPTIVTIVDITGKEVYHEELKSFDGVYSNEIRLSQETAAGTIFLNIRQGDKVFTEQIVYTNGRF